MSDDVHERPVRCPECNARLENRGATSRGDGDMFDELYCPECRCVRYERHASYCKCGDCLDGLNPLHRVDVHDDLDDFADDYTQNPREGEA